MFWIKKLKEDIRALRREKNLLYDRITYLEDTENTRKYNELLEKYNLTEWKEMQEVSCYGTHQYEFTIIKFNGKKLINRWETKDAIKWINNNISILELLNNKPKKK